MMFLELGGLAWLDESRLSVYYNHVYVIARNTMLACHCEPSAQTTWGSGILFVCTAVLPCATFAIELLARLRAFDWARIGLPRHVDNYRMAVHCGPVFSVPNPFAAHRRQQRAAAAATTVPDSHPELEEASHRPSKVWTGSDHIYMGEHLMYPAVFCPFLSFHFSVADSVFSLAPLVL